MGTNAGPSGPPIDEQLIFMKVPNVTKSSLIKSGKLKIRLNEENIVLIHSNGTFSAITEKCPHQGGPLDLGEIEEIDKSVCIRCPWHSWKFNIVSGECVFPGKSPSRKLRIFPLKVAENEVRIGFESIAQKYFNSPPSP